ncbi:MAG: phosphoadenosine phosphosulfate reductase [Candidatus Parabeggiatoa sp. nov. 1]|nr:MAG: phosphoadenosine phosphosulfate reductase [Gammaproteobacteria bacterium]
MTDKKVRHLLGLSGGKDSAALAIYLRDKVPEMEYFFADTGAELPETLEFIDIMADYLGKEIYRLNAYRGFEHYLKLHDNYLPTARSRWCTLNLKLFPFEKFVGNDEAITYVAIRADEAQREGYISKKPNIRARYPFKDDGLVKEDILRILEEAGIGLPQYYKWRSRSGCYFCFFQRKEEWIGLYENHPDLFEKARAYEQFHRDQGRNHTWTPSETLDDLIARASEIKQKSELRITRKKAKNLMEAVLMEEEDDPEDQACLICSL